MGRLDAALAYSSSQPKWFVYAIKDEWDRVAYIGSTKHPERRYIQHKDDNAHWQKPLRSWVSGNPHKFEIISTHQTKCEMISEEHKKIKELAPQFNIAP